MKTLLYLSALAAEKPSEIPQISNAPRVIVNWNMPPISAADSAKFAHQIQSTPIHKRAAAVDRHLSRLGNSKDIYIWWDAVRQYNDSIHTIADKLSALNDTAEAKLLDWTTSTATLIRLNDRLLSKKTHMKAMLKIRDNFINANFINTLEQPR